MAEIEDRDLSMFMQFVLVYREHKVFWDKIWDRDDCFKRLQEAGLVTVVDGRARATQKGKDLVDLLVSTARDYFLPGVSVVKATKFLLPQED